MLNRAFGYLQQAKTREACQMEEVGSGLGIRGAVGSGVLSSGLKVFCLVARSCQTSGSSEKAIQTWLLMVLFGYVVCSFNRRFLHCYRVASSSELRADCRGTRPQQGLQKKPQSWQMSAPAALPEILEQMSSELQPYIDPKP